MPLYKIKSDERPLQRIHRKQFANEEELHNLVEENLQELFGIRLIAREYPIPNGRIDSLGLDENSTPVIIEYKWKKEFSALVQGLFYLDWVAKNKKPFESIVHDKLGKDVEVDWSTQPRLLIVAQDFDVKELAAINQMEPRIELIKYSLYENLFNYENVNIIESRSTHKPGGDSKLKEHTLDDLLSNASPEMRTLFTDIRERILSMDESVWESVHGWYCDYRTVSTFVSVNLQKERLKMFIKMGDNELNDPNGICENIPKSWGYGLLNKQFTISNSEEIEYAMFLIQQAFDYVTG